jgi:hypothetical protein
MGGVGQQLADAGEVLPHGTPEARLGLALGQIVGGIALTVGGFTGEVLGGAATVTGIGVAVGVPAMVVSTTLVVGGAGNIAAGIRGLMTTGSGSSGSQATPGTRPNILPRSGPIGQSVGAMSRSERLARKLGLNINSATTRQVLNSLDMKVSDFVGQFRAGSIKGRLPSEVMDMTVEEALQHSSTVRKLLIDTRFVK